MRPARVPPRHAPPHRWVGALALLLAGCAASVPAPAPRPGSVAVPPETPPAPAAVLDGWYEGRQLPMEQTAVCSEREKKVWFRVNGQAIEMYASRHRRSAVRRVLLDGSVAADGRVVLQPQALDRSATGLIRGGVLSASDLPAAMDTAVRRHSCTYRYEAARTGAE